MPVCPACSTEAPAEARFCHSCGESFSSVSQLPTGVLSESRLRAAERRSPSSAPVNRLVSSDSLETGGYAPGTMLAGRYRIVGLLGRGGMGEVYRADDLKLGQPVALKFLPEGFAEDPGRRERFFGEVRLSRQVSHPNVCRVYDVGEAEGQSFLSMEYVDGEDLASLLKRIGRLPSDKALEIGRQLCAGLAAAHDRGVLHRDLKPANVMLDGRGRVRITDFGLAVAEGHDVSGEVTGTPSYMAPEQLEGKPATVRSDLYALGLVLYELWTGRKAYDAGTLADLKEKKRSLPSPPTESTREIDPVVERVILRCLDPDAARRPASAVQVAAALPGGDPLAAAIAAGETPSPEMVAAAGSEEGLSPRVAWIVAALALGLCGAVAWMTSRTHLLDLAGYRKPPEVLQERAREILARLGYADPVGDQAFGFRRGPHVLDWILENDDSPNRWDRLPTDAQSFWHRQSPRPMAPRAFRTFETVMLRVNPQDPPLEESGMSIVHLDPFGRLRQLESVPLQKDDSQGPPPAPDWAALFREAGMDMGKFQPLDPQWTPRTFADSRAAWSGPHPERPELTARVEAAAYRGKPVFFGIVGPWDTPTLQVRPPASLREQVGMVVWWGFFLAILLGGLLLARRNLRLGRGDPAGAARVGAFVGLGKLLAWALGASHTMTQEEIQLFINALGAALFYGATAGALYLALEPYIRRRWPQSLVSWSRLVSGRWKDPWVGREVLFGTAIGIVSAGIYIGVTRIPGWLGRPWGPPLPSYRVPLEGMPAALATMVESGIWAIFFGFMIVAFFTFLRAVVKSPWLAAPLLAATAVLSTTNDPVAVFLNVLLLAFVIMRLGILAGFATLFVSDVLDFPVTLDTSVWYFGAGALALGTVALLAIGSARMASRGRRALPAA